MFKFFECPVELLGTNDEINVFLVNVNKCLPRDMP